MQLLTTVLLVASVAAAAPAPAQGPTALRVRGSVTTEDGTAIERARVRTEAIAGVGGGQFVGQREFQAATDKKGQWGLLGITRGVWIFEVTADHHLPHVVAIPVAMTQAPVMPAMPWRLALTLQRTEESGAWAVALADVAKKAGTDRDGAAAELRRLSIDFSSPQALCAAGDVSLLLREFSLARQLFTKAGLLRPDWFRPSLGLASAAIAMRDYDAAIAAFWRVRDTSTSTELKQTVSAAVDDLQRLTNIK